MKTLNTPARAAWIAAVCATGLCQADNSRRRFDIPTGDAVQSFNLWAAQSGQPLLGSFEKIHGRITHEVHGELTPEDALRLMTADTGILCKYTQPRVMWCTLAPPTPAIALEPPKPVQRKEAVPEVLPEVTVTGTHFHGQSPPMTEIITLDRQDIERTGLATLAEVIRTLPQNFDGGPTEDTRQIGRETRTNAGMGTALNLRGMGPGETLVLLNGRRLVPGGSEGAFIDISSIPLTAVDHVDVLPESGSALYGADAIGGVVNIVLRREYSGFEAEGRAGTATEGGLAEYRASQTLGFTKGRTHALLALEYFEQGALPTADRAQSHSDLRLFGGNNFDSLQSNPGTLIAGGRMWAIPRGQDGTGLKPADFTPGTANLEDLYRGADLTALQRHWSLVGSLQGPLNDDVTLFADTFFSRRHPEQRSPGVRADLPVSKLNPFYVNPTGGSEPVVVSYDFIDDLGPLTADTVVDTSNSAIGANVALPSKWHLSTFGGYAREKLSQRQSGQVNFPALITALMETDPAKAFNPFADGSHTNPAVLDTLRADSSFLSDSALTSLNATVDGPLLPDRNIKVAFGTEYRHQSFDSELHSGAIIADSHLDTGRDIKAAFAELMMPVIQNGSERAGLHALDFSLALRFEDYSDVGSTTAPKLGVRWSPTAGVSLRSTWTRSFRAPNLADLFEGNNGSQLIPLANPTAPAGVIQALGWFGKNSGLKPEQARSWTLAAEIGPGWLDGWSAALTYFNVRIENMFTEHTFAMNALTDPQFASLIVRNPSPAQRAAVCSHSFFAGFSGDCLNAPIGAIVDFRLNNASLMLSHGLDLTLRHEIDVAPGHLELGVNGTYLLRYAEQDSPGSAPLELLNTQNNPLRLRLRSSVSWQQARFAATTFLNYAGAYRDTASQPSRTVGAWTTWDLQLRYDFPAATRLFLNVQNIFDRDPPFLNNHLGLGYDAENADLTGRVVSLGVVKKW